MKTIFVTFGGNTVALSYQGKPAEKIIHFLYQYAPQSPLQHHDQLVCNYRLFFDESAEEFVLYDNDTVIQRSSSEPIIADFLQSAVCQKFAAQAHGGLVFHAAGVRWRGQGIILPGQTGSGKTTLSAWLLSRGCDYLTDELVFIPYQTKHYDAFPRPLSSKLTARSALSDFVDLDAIASQVLTSTFSDFIDPRLLGCSSIAHTSPLHLIIFPCYQTAGTFKLSRLSKAQTGLALLQNLVNARNLSDHGFSEVTRLARIVPAYQLMYSHISQVEQPLEELFEQPFHPKGMGVIL